MKKNQQAQQEAVERHKKAVAQAAWEQIAARLEDDDIIGVGSGSTVNYFIAELAQSKKAQQKARLGGVVAASEESTRRLKEGGIPVVELNATGGVRFYVDGADEADHHLRLIKGGGAALTREKVIAASASEFLCIADESKLVGVLGRFPLPVEVIPMARSHVARQLAALGGKPAYRQDCVTDNGNHLIDVHNLDLSDPPDLERRINHIAGVVCNGLFAMRGADRLLLGTAEGVREVTPAV